jgi:hypothetical protein
VSLPLTTYLLICASQIDLIGYNRLARKHETLP